MHYRTFSSILGLYPLDSSSTPPPPLGVMTKTVCTHCQMSPGGKAYLPIQLRSTRLEQSQSSLIRKADVCWQDQPSGKGRSSHTGDAEKNDSGAGSALLGRLSS